MRWTPLVSDVLTHLQSFLSLYSWLISPTFMSVSRRESESSRSSASKTDSTYVLSWACFAKS
jgi:hypothetical protein